MSAIETAIDYLLSEAKTAKVDLEVLATERKSTSISFQTRKMDQFAFSETHQLGVRVLDGHHEGVAFSESLEPANLKELMLAARDNARMIEKEWISELHPAETLPALNGMFNPELEQIPVKDKIATASTLESAALEFDPGIRGIAYTRYSDSAGTVWIANTKGLRGTYRQNSCLGYTYCLAQDGDNTVMAGEAESHRSFTALDAKRIARKAAEKALARRGASRPDTGKYTVVFENRAAESLIGFIEGYFSAKSLDEKTSPLQGKLEQTVFSPHLTLLDDPFFLSATGCRPFDEEGYASKKTTLVEKGVLKSFLTNSVLARKLKLPHTASASRAPSSDLDVSASNILVRPGTKSLADLIGADSKVILVTDLTGSSGFRATSGDFSIPMEGHLYENGKRSAPLKDFLISGNILQLLASVAAVGNDVLAPVGNIVCPSLLIHDLNVIGKS
jgi:PmbA protein